MISFALASLALLNFVVPNAAVHASVQVGPHLQARYYHDASNLDPLASRTRHRRRANSRHQKRSCAASAIDTHKKPSKSSSSSAVPKSTSTSKPSSKTPVYNWTDSSNVMYGANLGSWLMLEKWMTGDLFSKFAPNAVDDYTFEQTLGSKAASVLKSNHWDTYVTEQDIEDLSNAGVNVVRIPFGYWAFHANVGGDPFAALSGQQDQITRVLGYLAKRGMYAILDLHSAVGRASEDQCNGRLNGPVQFYDDNMQAYHDAVIRNIYKYSIQSKYRNNIAAIALVNEPDVCMSSKNQQRIDAIGGYYQRSYKFIMAQDDPIPLIAHHGYCGIQQWQSMVSKMNPDYFLMEDHPYCGTFAQDGSTSEALGGVCQKAQEYVQYPVPVLLTEATQYYRVGNGDSNFASQMLAQQMSVWALSGGLAWWSFKGNGGNDGWNMLQQVQNGALPTPDKNQTLTDWMSSFDNNCGITTKPSWAR